MSRRYYHYFFQAVTSTLNIAATFLAACLVLMQAQTFDGYNTKNLTYRVYQDFQLNGCRLVNLKTDPKTRLACAISCTTDTSCAAYKFLDDSSDCWKCRRNEATEINFVTGEFTSLPRVMRKRNWPFASGQFTNRSVQVPGGLKAGMVVHLTGLVLPNVDFYVNFEQQDNQRDVNFHFHVRLRYGTAIPILVLNHYTGNTWGTEVVLDITPYPFKANTTTGLHILVRDDMFVLYIDNKVCCNYTHVPGMLYTKVNYIRVIGDIQVYEISS